MRNEAITLSQLHFNIHEAISHAFPRSIWLVAEISELNENRNGHCYLELVETNESQKVIARTRATIWANKFFLLKSYFETSTNQRFSAGIKIMVEVSVDFHQLYGFSLNIKNINPTYTLGDMALKRKAIIEKLKLNGVYTMNKELELPLVAQRIAIISSPTAAGLQDFLNQLHQNAVQITFHTELFEAIMQGEQTAPSVIAALEAIAEFQDDFDLVVIIRGGGSQLDLASFDNYELANHVAQFPLPVITGIGHDKDETIIDLVAHAALKTPTAVAEFLITKASDFYYCIVEFNQRLQQLINAQLNKQSTFLKQAHHRLKHAVRNRIEKEELKLNNQSLNSTKLSKQFLNHQLLKLERNVSSLVKGIPIRLKSEIRHFDYIVQNTKHKTQQIIQAQEARLNAYEIRKRLTDPKQILRRGYAVIYKGSELIKSSAQLQAGDKIETQLATGKVKSIVTKE